MFKSQFLVEAVTLFESLMGGAIGIVLGLIGSALISNLLIVADFDPRTRAIIAAAFFSPQQLGSSLDTPRRRAKAAQNWIPIEALRYE